MPILPAVYKRKSDNKLFYVYCKNPISTNPFYNNIEKDENLSVYRLKNVYEEDTFEDIEILSSEIDKYFHLMDYREYDEELDKRLNTIYWLYL